LARIDCTLRQALSANLCRAELLDSQEGVLEAWDNESSRFEDSWYAYHVHVPGELSLDLQEFQVKAVLEQQALEVDWQVTIDD